MSFKYANIAFNLPINSLFTYSIPEILKDEINLGSRVVVPFGKRNLTGIVTEFSGSTALLKVKPIIKILDTVPLLRNEMLQFSKWISNYYVCPVGEVLFSAIPKGISAESKIVYSIAENANTKGLTALQLKIIAAIGGNSLTVKQIEKRLKAKNLRSTIAALHKKGKIVREFASMGERVKPKFETYIKFNLLNDFEGFSNEMIDTFFRENKIKSLKQTEVLRYLIKNNIPEIQAKELVNNSGSSSPALKSLAKKEFITLFKKQVTRKIEHEFSEEKKNIILNDDQANSLKAINEAVDRNQFITFLLFGVTGSGKTQVYLEAIANALKQDKTAIVLVPEISLTPQLIHRFRTFFGDIIGVIHSRLSDGQRLDVNSRIRTKEIKIIIGARSALFAPIDNLGIIIVDEEHDHSYKQTEKNPRYNARDSALVRAKINNAVVVLGSATPSLETFYNAKGGKYTLLELPHRAMKTKQPVVEIVSMIEELRKTSKYQKRETPETRFLSSRLISYIDYALKNNQSIMLLQNRRGYSAYIECQECGFVKMCRDCDITMIYHKTREQLRCHYCGYSEKLPVICEKCGSDKLLLKGTGTEKVEEEIARLFPQAKMKRMDSDTVKGRDAHRKILRSFHDREFDILIGTQMISKGLDFPNVYLVGVVSADVGLLNADFRSSEKTFQLLTQVSGRSGRISDHGKVIIQTMHPSHFIFQYIIDHNYEGFYDKELANRRKLNYPPFSRMSLIEVTGPDIQRVNSIASKIYLYLRQGMSKIGQYSISLMKPSPALIYKIKNKYRYHVIIKTLKNSHEALHATEELLRQLDKYVNELKIKSN